MTSAPMIMHKLLMVSMIEMCLSSSHDSPLSTAYECRINPGYSVHPIKLSSSCAVKNVIFNSSSRVESHIVSIAPSIKVEATRCSIETHTIDIYCYYSRYPEERENPSKYEGYSNLHVSSEQCDSMVNDGLFVYEGESHTVERGRETKIIYSSALDSEGWCASWKVAATKTIIKVNIADTFIDVSYDTDTSQFKYYNHDNVELSLLSKQYLTSTIGVGYKIIHPVSVRNFTEVIYSGEGREYTYTNGDTVLYIPQITSALQLHEKIIYVMLPLQTTDMPNLYWTSCSSAPSVYKTSRNHPSLDLLVGSSINYLAVGGDIQNQALQVHMKRNFCTLERRIIEIIVSMKGLKPEQLGYLLLGNKGYAAYVAGDVVTIQACLETPFFFRELETCYSLLPVTWGHNNTSGFLDPLTSTIHTTALSLPCDDPSIPVMCIRSQCYKYAPRRVAVRTDGPLPSTIDHPLLRRIYNSTKLFSLSEVRTTRAHINLADKIASASNRLLSSVDTDFGGRSSQSSLTWPSIGESWHWLSGISFSSLLSLLLAGFVIHLWLRIKALESPQSTSHSNVTVNLDAEKSINQAKRMRDGLLRDYGP